jgi:hypothetical protein
MLNESQVKYLRNLVRMGDNWNSANPCEDLENAMSAFAEETGINPTFHLNDEHRGYYTVSPEDLTRVRQLDPFMIP